MASSRSGSQLSEGSALDRSALDRAVREAVDRINADRLWQPQVAIILGSGLGGLGDDIQHASHVPYEQIPNFRKTHAVGHKGQLVLGFLSGMPVVVMQGRYHRYEGHSDACVAFPVRVMAALGAKTLLVTNAAGGLNPRYLPGDLMLVDQHINCLWPRTTQANIASASPALASASSGSSSPSPVGRYLTSVYDSALLEQAARIARQCDVNLQRGTYTATLGPTYETRSEYRMFRWMGGDAVGMSTVPEVLAARQAGMRVLAMSVITNVACTDQAHGTSHEEVVARGKAVEPKLRQLVAKLLEEMAGPAD
jgi:purine-nucleoside phosphorylase